MVYVLMATFFLLVVSLFLAVSNEQRRLDGKPDQDPETIEKNGEFKNNLETTFSDLKAKFKHGHQHTQQKEESSEEDKNER